MWYWLNGFIDFFKVLGRFWRSLKFDCFEKKTADWALKFLNRTIKNLCFFKISLKFVPMFYNFRINFSRIEFKQKRLLKSLIVQSVIDCCPIWKKMLALHKKCGKKFARKWTQERIDLIVTISRFFFFFFFFGSIKTFARNLKKSGNFFIICGNISKNRSKDHKKSKFYHQ